MSIEIEVGLENAAKVRPIPEEFLLDEPPKGLKNPKVRRLLVLGGSVLLLALIGLLAYYHNRESTDDAQVDGHITPVASKIYGRVAEVLVNDNEPVKAGQVLVKIDPRDYQASLDQAKAALALAESDAASAGVDVPRTRENVVSGNSSASAQLSGAEADLERARVTYDQARTSDLAWAQANIEKSKANAELAHADLRQISMRTSDAQGKIAKVQQARAVLQAAELNLNYTDIVAPVDGVATHKQVEPGQIVQQGQGLLVVVPLQNVWVTANFKETQLRKMKPGQKAYVHVDTYGKTFTGHLDSIAGATGAVLSLLPPENATGNYVKVVQRIPVKIVLDPIPQEKAILRPGMNVDATIITQ